jgi:hypothetical protein
MKKYKNINPFAIYDPLECEHEMDQETHWEDFQNDLEEEFDDHCGKHVFIKGKNIGWQNLDHQWVFELKDAMDIFNNLIPKTSDLTYYLYKLDHDKYAALIYHHDAPTGETYEFKIAA